MNAVHRAVLAILLVIGVHYLGMHFDWYEAFVWFDIPMHIAGGAVIGLLAMATWGTQIKKITFTNTASPIIVHSFKLIWVLGCVALVGIGWEWYEYVFAGYSQASVADTLADLYFDLLGALLMFIFGQSRLE